MGRLRKNIIPFKVINGNFNTSQFEGYDVMYYLINCYKDIRRKKRCPKTYDEFKKWVDNNLRYMYWARCQYEIILIDSKKIQEQIELNNEYEDLINAQQYLVQNNPNKPKMYFSDKEEEGEATYQLIEKTQKVIRQYYNNQQKIDVYYQVKQNFDVLMLVFLYNIGKLDLIENFVIDSFNIMVKDDNNENVIKWFNIFEDLHLIDKKLNKNKIKEFLLNYYKDDSSGLTILSWPCYTTLGDLTISHQIELNIDIIVELIKYKFKFEGETNNEN
jgi:hypothetical protein